MKGDVNEVVGKISLDLRRVVKIQDLHREFKKFTVKGPFKNLKLFQIKKNNAEGEDRERVARYMVLQKLREKKTQQTHTTF